MNIFEDEDEEFLYGSLGVGRKDEEDDDAEDEEQQENQREVNSK